ncbi:hypothetical protein GCK32_002414 [Trichostrongylus colubriformis]|uniref:Uncharacterized protein n=1 Tax=Trichostrongylus colubriformis TaxID=6319 RepID=A0AAN8IRT4_TRICO
MIHIEIGNVNVCISILNPKPAPLNYATWLLYAVELLATSLALFYMSRLIRLFGKTSLFHENLVRISIALFISNYPNVGARVVLFLYEVDVLKLEENSAFPIIIAVACFIRIWSMNVVLLYLPSVIIERSFASKYIHDYEKFPRPCIHMTIIPFIYAMSALLALCNMLNYFNFAILASSTAVFFITYCVAYITLFRRDLVKLRDIKSGRYQKYNTYTLSTKFQLEENLRVMKILMQLSITWAVCALFACLSFVLATIILVDYLQWSQMSYTLLNVLYAISLNAVTWIFTNAVGRIRLRFSLPWSTKIETLQRSRAVDEHRGASQAYFKQLNTAWNV